MSSTEPVPFLKIVSDASVELVQPSLPAAHALPRYSPQRLLKRALIGVVLVSTITAGSAWLLYATTETSAEHRKALLGPLTTWADQSSASSQAKVATTSADLIVVDPTLVEAGSQPRTTEALGQLQTTPKGARRLVLGYLSIGAAQDVRPYWRGDWVREDNSSVPTGLIHKTAALAPSRAAAPSVRADSSARSGAASGRASRMPSAIAPQWLGPELQVGRGNYQVDVSHSGWHALLYGSSGASLDQLITMGFDGVYLDPVSPFGRGSGGAAPAANDKSKHDLADLVVRMTAYARRLNPAFVVTLANGDSLVDRPEILRAVDAIVATPQGLHRPASLRAARRLASVSEGNPMLILADRERMASAK